MWLILTPPSLIQNQFRWVFTAPSRINKKHVSEIDKLIDNTRSWINNRHTHTYYQLLIICLIIFFVWVSSNYLLKVRRAKQAIKTNHKMAENVQIWGTYEIKAIRIRSANSIAIDNICIFSEDTSYFYSQVGTDFVILIISISIFESFVVMTSFIDFFYSDFFFFHLNVFADTSTFGISPWYVVPMIFCFYMSMIWISLGQTCVFVISLMSTMKKHIFSDHSYIFFMYEAWLDKFSK